MTTAPPPSETIERFRRDVEVLLDNGPDRLGLAVSGGPDSLALLLLAHGAYPGRVHAATVDHGLRPESAQEAELAARHCATIGVPHATLTVSVIADGSGVQASARRARYQALGGWLAADGINSLITAHHKDDQAETLLMRLLRGSGVAGLAGVRPRIPFPAAGENASILRPLLGWRRSELAAIVDTAGLEAVQDPSNSNEVYDRVRIRRLLRETPWLDPVALARSAAALAEAEEALEEAAQLHAAERISLENGVAALRPDNVPRELLRRLILYCLRLVVPAAAPRGEQLTALIDQLHRGQVVTLAGVKCSGGSRFLFEPAPPRRS